MTTVLEAKVRKEFKGSTLTKLRGEGQVPGVLYGYHLENQSIHINEGDFLKVMKQVGRNGVFSVDVEGKKMDVMLTDFQMNPIKNELVHVDLFAVDMKKEMTADVKVNVVGDASGVKEGGVLQQILHEVSVTATPDHIPQSIDVDVTELQVNETITIGDLKSSKDFTIEHEGEEVLVTILPPKQEEEVDSGETQGEGTDGEEETGEEA